MRVESHAPEEGKAPDIIPEGLTSTGSLQRLGAIEQESYVSRI